MIMLLLGGGRTQGLGYKWVVVKDVFYSKENAVIRKPHDLLHALIMVT